MSPTAQKIVNEFSKLRLDRFDLDKPEDRESLGKIIDGEIKEANKPRRMILDRGGLREHPKQD